MASVTSGISSLDSLSFLCEIREIFNEFVKNEILMHCIITVSKHINFSFWRFLPDSNTKIMLPGKKYHKP